MLKDLFTSSELVRVVDFLLDEPGTEFNKSEIAEGAGISRPTLYSLWERISELGLIRPGKSRGEVETYALDTRSLLVRSLVRFDSELSKAMAEAGISTQEERQEPILINKPRRGA